jgi:hypothetical protein
MKDDYLFSAHRTGLLIPNPRSQAVLMKLMSTSQSHVLTLGWVTYLKTDGAFLGFITDFPPGDDWWWP